MKKIFVSGASITYGVGGPEGGWVDMLKREVHARQFSDPYEDICYVYNFAKPGWAASDVLASFPKEITDRHSGKPEDVLAVVGIGMNDVKATPGPEDFYRTPEQFEADLHELYDALDVYQMIATGMLPVFESKVTPKENDRGGSWFYNDRISEFNTIAMRVAAEHGATTVDWHADALAADWQNNYISADGLHPNAAGHRWLYEQMKPILMPFIA